MTDKRVLPQGEEEFTIKIPPTPDFSTLPPEVREWAEATVLSIQSLVDEFDRDGSKSMYPMGIAWADMFSVFKDHQGEYHQIKINVTGRSGLDTTHAMKNLFAGFTFGRTKGFYPYPIQPPVSKRPSAHEKAQPPATTEPPSQPANPLAPPAAGTSATGGRFPHAGQTPNAPAGRVVPPSQPPAQPPAGSKPPAQSFAGAWLPVTSMAVDLTTSGDLYVRVKSPGKFSKYGLAAYLDSSGMPEDVIENVKGGDWKPKKEFSGEDLKASFPDMLWIHVSDDEKKVVGFSAEKPV